MPTSTSPLLVCAVNAPLTALATATDPDAVCVLALPCSRPIVIPPLAAWNFRSPSSSPIVASPEAVEMDALPEHPLHSDVARGRVRLDVSLEGVERYVPAGR